MAHVDLIDGVDMGTFKESDFQGSTVLVATSTQQLIEFFGNSGSMSITGTGFTYDNGVISGGIVTGLEVTSANGHFVLTGAHTDGSLLESAFLTDNAQLSISTLLSGNDVIDVQSTNPQATNVDSTGMGWGGDDLMIGGGSRSSLFGGDGDDTIQANTGDGNYLRGEAGDDSVVGASGFDDINGNMGNDTIDGGSGGGDWLVGGQGNDLITSHHSNDILYGNLGNDTLLGGDGAETIRGGQGADSISGGAGNDYISGDLGADTESGGPGADIFHESQGAGIDKVLDFDAAEGDRVMLDPGTTFTLSQVGADTVINMGGGDEMILVGVKLSTLTGNWIFESF